MKRGHVLLAHCMAVLLLIPEEPRLTFCLLLQVPITTVGIAVVLPILPAHETEVDEPLVANIELTSNGR